MTETDTYELQLIRVAATAQLDAHQVPPHSPELVANFLDSPMALDFITAEEQPHAAGLVWRLGAASMTGAVLTNVAEVDFGHPRFLRDPYFNQGQNIARELLRAQPGLLENIGSLEAAAFWELAGYDPTMQEPSNVFGLLDVLEVLRNASYLPPELLAQMRHYRDSPPTTSFSLGVEQYEPPEIEEAMVRPSIEIPLATFVARHTGSGRDRHIAFNAVKNFATNQIVDTIGMRRGLSMWATLKAINIGQTAWETELIGILQQAIVDFAPQADLTSLSRDGHDELSELIHLAELAYRFAQDTQNPTAEALVQRITAELELFENMSAHDPHLMPLSTHDGNLNFVDRVVAHSSNAALQKTLRLVKGEPEPVATVESVMQRLANDKFSLRFVHQAFQLVCAELDPTKKAELLANFDAAIGSALHGLGPDHPSHLPNALQSLNHEAHVGLFAYFPSGRRFIADRVRAYGQLINHQLGQARTDQRPFPSYMASTWLNELRLGLSPSQKYFEEGSKKREATIQIVRSAVANITNYFGISEEPTDTDSRMRQELMALLEQAESAFTTRVALGKAAIQTETTLPLDQLLLHYQPQSD
jgi:hypothetical protein